MVRERPGKVPGNRFDLDYVSAAVERESRYKGSGGGGGEGTDAGPGEGQSPVPERPVRVTPLRPERGVHNDDLPGPVPVRHVRDREIHPGARRPGGRAGDRNEPSVDLHADHRTRAEERGADREAAGTAPEVEDRTPGEAEPSVEEVQEIRGGPGRSGDLFERSGRLTWKRDRLDLPNELIPSHRSGKPGLSDDDYGLPGGEAGSRI